MPHAFHTVDVFTTTRFGGNPLAVLPDARGLSDAQMQHIAREFNYSETTFVLPPADPARHVRRVRIFTPTGELPFAGHPNVGTAFVLASTGAFGELASSSASSSASPPAPSGASTSSAVPTSSVASTPPPPQPASFTVTFEELAGDVAVAIHTRDGRVASCEVAAPSPLELGTIVPAELVAAAVSLDVADVLTTTHPPVVASVGYPFLFAEVRDREALARCRANPAAFEAIQRLAVRPSLYVYARVDGADGYDLRARMFAPLLGVPEDPATGSAACSVAGLVAHHDPRTTADVRLRIAQGVEMGRPSTLMARATKAGGIVGGTWVEGACVAVSVGTIEVG